MTPEAKARQQIDKLLERAGWAVQHFRHGNISASSQWEFEQFCDQKKKWGYLV
ncbi:MAG: hypothetical protein HZB31_02255 [Nitrospirae bacterium]|nr:hypothetical protein [Nitrospirota bacterium]